MFLVLGSICSGIATPSEAAAVNVLGALVTTALTGQFLISLVMASLMNTLRVSAMVLMLVVAAAFLAAAIACMHLPADLTEVV